MNARHVLVGAAALAFACAAQAQKTKAEPKKDAKPAAAAAPAPLRAKAELKSADGKKLGTVTLEQLAHGVLVSGELAELPPGGHAFHVHEVGKCEAPFTTAGGHFNHAQKKHGAKSHEGAHAGDLPNLFGENGKVKFEVVAHDISLKKDAPGNVFDADGSALVLHATVDDYLTDPAGNAGGRIACGVIVADAAK
jgi:Cu-Zn family superoxide dismutase